MRNIEFQRNTGATNYNETDTTQDIYFTTQNFHIYGKKENNYA